MGLLASTSRRVPTLADCDLATLVSPSGLRAQLLPSGAVQAWRHDRTLINQLLPGPGEDGLFRLLLRWRDGAGEGGTPLAGVGLHFAIGGSMQATWSGTTLSGLTFTTSLQLHPQRCAWAWRIRLVNASTAPVTCEVFHAQDLGLADEAAVRNNEAYVSQYLDLRPVDDPTLGTVLLARQNQAMTGGRHPWAAFACVGGSAGWCTDGYQFFGADHRLTGEPRARRTALLPSRLEQYELALAGLQSRPLILAPGKSGGVAFVARFLPDHSAASSADDLALLREVLPLAWAEEAPAVATDSPAESTASVFVSAPWLHGVEPSADDLAAWFPGPWRHEERDDDRHLLSFFCATDTHVVTRRKEALVARPHGHVVRSGDSRWIDDGHFGVTCYAAGIFGAQAYLGNPNLARLLSVVRNPLNVARASGQRVFVRTASGWAQLGVPSAFALTPGSVQWIYRWADRTIAARVWCAGGQPAAFLELHVIAGAPAEFLVTHQLALGANEFESGGRVEIFAPEGWMQLQMNPEDFAGKRLPGTAFALGLVDPAQAAAWGGDELLGWGGGETATFAAVQTRPIVAGAVILTGTTRGEETLPGAVAAARAAFAQRAAAVVPSTALRLTGTADPVVARVNDILPWFAHNASIHFSAPHGLEQYGGAAWGVRDVCQGSLEWLLAAGDLTTARRMLATVFAQQYAGEAAQRDGVDGAWPQWFMFPPFHAIQQTHSHGDVCFWPVKALCDYVEATGDFDFLDELVGYTEVETFRPEGREEDLWTHCDRVLRHVETRFVTGTALVNYGDGDWDDTLQPADPALRTRMVSAWTVALAFHVFRQFAEVCRRAGEDFRAARIDALLARMRKDFAERLMPGGTTAGFLVVEADGSARALLHPTDTTTGIRHRLLPMTRSILAELFTLDEAKHHLELIERELRFPDGVRLMSEPATYAGGVEKLFKRAETAANVGREIGLQYVHAHLRYAEALAKVGDADRLWWALQVVNPVALSASVPNAAPRQSNVYFSSSDADFGDRYEAKTRWDELRTGDVAVRGGWRLYSSGPGLYLHKVRACLLGVRESFGDVVFDPVLPRSLDGLVAEVNLCERPVRIRYAVRHGTSAPRTVRVNGDVVTASREANPYREGGLRVPAEVLAARLRPADNLIEVEL